MNVFYYIGLDIHKKTISYCLKQINGRILREGIIYSRHKDIIKWYKKVLGRAKLTYRKSFTFIP